jgi:hypothetical protein
MSRAAKPVAIAARVKSIRPDATAAQLAEIDAELRAEIEAADAEAKRLAAGRNAVLLDGDDDAIAAHDAAAAKAGHRLERANLLLAGIAQRLADRQTQEASWAEAARLDTLRDEAAALSEKLRGMYQSGYVEPAVRVTEFLHEWAEGHKKIEQINEALKIAGRRSDYVKSPEDTLRTAPWYDLSEPEEWRDTWVIGNREIGPDEFTYDRQGNRVPKDSSAFRAQVPVKTRPHHRPNENLPALAGHVNLPAPSWGQAAFWKGSQL